MYKYLWSITRICYFCLFR